MDIMTILRQQANSQALFEESLSDFHQTLLNFHHSKSITLQEGHGQYVDDHQIFTDEYMDLLLNSHVDFYRDKITERLIKALPGRARGSIRYQLAQNSLQNIQSIKNGSQQLQTILSTKNEADDIKEQESSWH